jgi:hypothetical protein
MVAAYSVVLRVFKGKRHKELVTPVVAILDTPPTLILNLGILPPDGI